MRIAVCIKQIPDPEVAPTQFRVDEEARKAVPWPGTAQVISPFDEQAIEAALRLRDAGADAHIVLFTLGGEEARGALKAGLALGADEGVLLSDAAFEGADSFVVATALAAALGKMGAFDLILCGRQAADDDAGVVGPGLAELLGLPCLTFAQDVSLDDGNLRVERVLEDCVEVAECSLPAVVTVAHELGPPRKASLRETMRAARKPIASWTASDLGLAAGARRRVERMFAPETGIECDFLDGESPEALVAALVDRLRAEQLV